MNRKNLRNVQIRIKGTKISQLKVHEDKIGQAAQDINKKYGIYRKAKFILHNAALCMQKQRLRDTPFNQFPPIFQNQAFLEINEQQKLAHKPILSHLIPLLLPPSAGKKTIVRAGMDGDKKKCANIINKRIWYLLLTELSKQIGSPN